MQKPQSIKTKTQALLSKSIIITFLTVPILSSFISTFHLFRFFELGNWSWMAIILGVAFEIGSVASLLTITILDKIKSWMIYSIFFILVFMQILGNIYFSFDYINQALLEDPNWLNSARDFFSYLLGNDLQTIKIFLAFLIGTPIPLISLLFFKSIVDYLKPNENETINIDQNVTNTNITERRTFDTTKEVVHGTGTGYPETNNTSISTSDKKSNYIENENQNKDINDIMPPGYNPPHIIAADDPERI